MFSALQDLRFSRPLHRRVQHGPRRSTEALGPVLERPRHQASVCTSQRLLRLWIDAGTRHTLRWATQKHWLFFVKDYGFRVSYVVKGQFWGSSRLWHVLISLKRPYRGFVAYIQSNISFFRKHRNLNSQNVLCKSATLSFWALYESGRLGTYPV